MKKILKILGIVLAAIVILVAVLLWRIDSIIKTAIEQGAPRLLGCKATVEKISVKPFSGRVLVKNLKLASPEGYVEPEMFSIGEFRLKVDVGSVLKGSDKPVIINEVVINEPLIAYEVVGSKSNFQHLMDRLPKSDPDATEKPKDKDAKKPGRKVIIDRVEFRDGQVNVRAGYTLGYGIPLPLPGIELADIGRASGGVTAVQAVGSVLGSLASSVTELVTASAKIIADQAKNLAEGAVDAGKAVLETGKDAGKAVIDAGKGLMKGVKGLLD